jgi:hypothetical protein
VKEVQVELGTIPTKLMQFKSFKTNKDASLKCLKPTNMYHNPTTEDIVATICSPTTSAKHSYYMNERGTTVVTPRNNGAYCSDSDESTSRDWKTHAFNLEREIWQLKDMVETLCAQTEMHRLDVIARLQRRVFLELVTTQSKHYSVT